MTVLCPLLRRAAPTVQSLNYKLDECVLYTKRTRFATFNEAGISTPMVGLYVHNFGTEELYCSHRQEGVVNFCAIGGLCAMG